MIRIVPFLFLWPLAVLAQSTSPGAAPIASTTPVSVSYENVLKCFPELKDDALAFKVNLTKLKEIADDKFVTIRSQLRQRKVNYLNADKEEMNLILKYQQVSLKKQKVELSVQTIAHDGVLTELALTKNQRTNPKQEIINNFLLNGTIKSDVYSYLDTKPNGMSASYKRNFREVIEYNLEGSTHKRSLSCSNEPQLGIICTCSKKP
ncbi:hypothetical protein B9G69_003575 [Bdellovibrio sp. SKB1291214]|uniref:hypothetical protein n=1 Tax=Bdellovibrio sp. SKB1291214 TaxID=1732569 RepID=UPI0020CE88EF|nr:hypothetical protein [Bdellovibrio sp. SKB1291214]UYL09652.1 hypothetical protein B9G69_003575 [Bdellovibrio sp. SKB1291214]